MGRVIHFEIPVTDSKKAIRFYGAIFGWKFDQYGDIGYWLVTTGEEKELGVNGALTQKPANGIVEIEGEIMDASQAINAVITIDVENLDLTLQQIREMGGKVTQERMTVPKVGYIAYFKDIDGNLLCAMQSDENAQ